MPNFKELLSVKNQLESQNRLLAGLVDSLPFGVALFDDRQVLSIYNKLFRDLLGYTDDVLKQSGFSFRDLIRLNGDRGDYPDQPWTDVYAHFDGLMQAHQGIHFERQANNGMWLEITATPILNGWTILSYADITQKKAAIHELERAQQNAMAAIAEQKLAREEVERIAYHDPLTGLPNRRLFSDRAEQAVAVAARQKYMLAICYLDLDGFKQVNDTYGHDAGDKLLSTIGNRLTECVRAHDTVCRLGGDEFVLLLTNVTSNEEVLTVLQRVLTEIALPVPISATASSGVSASIGYALYPDDAIEKGHLIRQADHAMYDAKGQGKNRIVRFRLDDQPTFAKS